MNDKKTVVVFTTKLFNEKNYLFNEDECDKIKLSNDSTLGQFHVKKLKDQDINYLFRLMYQDLVGEDEKRMEFLIERRSKVSAELQSNIDGLRDKISNKSSDEVSINDCVLFDRKVDDKHPFTFEEVITKLSETKEPENIGARKYIYRRKDEYIFGYRCLESFDDFFNNNDNTFKEGFVSDIVTDVANYLLQHKNKSEEPNYHHVSSTNNLDDFFSLYKLVLVLHEEDIGYPRGYNTCLADEEKKNFLFKYNSELESYKDNIEAYVFQHTANIFVKYLTDFNDNKADSKKLSQIFKIHTKNKSEFEKVEIDVFKGGNKAINISKLKDSLKKFEDSCDKIY